jgi:glycosyltransferase involved in cell wall biosynthesis
MKDAQPLVTVIVVTLNNLNLLRNCLRSLYAQDYAAMEIVVVDNGSDDDIAGMVSAEFPKVRMIRLDKNHGFAGGNNRGIEMAQGEYVALINNDAVASPTWLSSLVETAESDSKIGAVASIVIDGNQPEALDSCEVGIGLGAFGISALVQFIALLALYLFSQAIQLERPPTIEHVFYAAPLAIATGSLPLPGSGLGVGEVAFDQLLSRCRTKAYEPIEGGAGVFLMSRCWGVILSLIGLPFYLRSRRGLSRSILISEMEREYNSNSTTI